MKTTAYPLGRLDDYKFTVVFARYQGAWLLCRHKGRNTWENAGGHIEADECPLDCAKRELHEETGALDFDIWPVCDYWACREPHEEYPTTWANGQVFLAEVRSLGPLPRGSEMAEIRRFDSYPLGDATYPEITREIYPWAASKAVARGLVGQ